MRMRRKPWARPELAACPFAVNEPSALRGHWREEFGNENPIHLELGCGKGTFIARLGADHPEWNLIAIDIKSEVLVLAKRQAEAVYAEQGKNPISNLRIFSQDIERLPMVLSEEEKIDRIYINFCNPWPKKGYQKHRLTHSKQLTMYRRFLRENGEIWFKTDDDGLFDDSLDYFRQSGYHIVRMTRDLHAEPIAESPVTEHEEMFSRQGIPIKFLIARMEPVQEGENADENR